ncbi:MAG: hypothetical protein WBO77_02680, partial [Microgenomates group bacterium]
IRYASLDNTTHFCNNEYMSETFTPLQSPYVSHSQSSLSKKQVIGAVTTLGLLVAIGGSFLFIGRTQTTSTKAYSTNECAAAGGYQMALCPDGTTTLGGISDGTTHSCCVPNDSQQTQTTTQTTTQNTPGTNTPGGGDGDQAPPPDVVPPNSCKVPDAQLTIECPDPGCRK